MAATRPNIAFAEPSATSTTAGGVSMRIAAVLVAIACIGTGLAMCAAYPIRPLLAMGLFVGWTAVATVRPSVAIPGLLALLPMIGFATWTGWLTFEETDLMVLASSAGGYASAALSGRERIVPGDRRFLPRLSIFSAALMLAFFASEILSLQRGFLAAGGFRFDWYQNYFDPLNGLRVFKSFAWALLLTPLLLREARKPGFFDRFAVAMTIALGLCSLVVFQERIAFTGLLDFSDDYRATGPFWENHVGGVALEGFLGLAIPFAVREALRPAGTPVAWSRVIAASIVLVAAGYACFVTFTRGLYLAVPISMVVLGVLVSRQHRRSGAAVSRPALRYGALLGTLACVCAFVVFRHGGYRTVLAMLIAAIFALPLEASLRRSTVGMRLTAIVGAIIIGGFVLLVGTVLSKGAYVAFVAACIATGCAIFLADRKPARALEIIAMTAWLTQVVCACGVALHWGGTLAFRDCAVAAAVLIALVLSSVLLRKPIHSTLRQGQLVTAAFVALLMGAVAVFNAGTYAGGRIDTSSGDLSARLNHWRAGLDQLRDDDWLFGKGLGRFPATSLSQVMDVPTPGSYAYFRRSDGAFVRVTSPRLRYIGNDELFRFSQRIAVRPHTNYRVAAHVRAPRNTELHFEICEKQLIYSGNCVGAERTVQAGANNWQLLDFVLDTGEIGAAPWYAPKPVFFALGPYEPPGGSIDIRLVRMIGPDGVDILANGDFANRTAHWFSSSDKYHLPWRIENMYLDTLFAQGAIGLVAFSLLIVAALLRTSFGRAARHPDAPYVAAAITAALIIGVFDSLTDTPRVALLFYLAIILGLVLRNPRATVPASKGAPRPDVPLS